VPQPRCPTSLTERTPVVIYRFSLHVYRPTILSPTPHEPVNIVLCNSARDIHDTVSDAICRPSRMTSYSCAPFALKLSFKNSSPWYAKPVQRVQICWVKSSTSAPTLATETMPNLYLLWITVSLLVLSPSVCPRHGQTAWPSRETPSVHNLLFCTHAATPSGDCSANTGGLETLVMAQHVTTAMLPLLDMPF
jgi:hypothetical protein